MGNDVINVEDILLRETQPPHLDQVLRDLGDPLLALVCHKVWPVDKFVVDLFVDVMSRLVSIPCVAFGY
jgi:hypothetical protein